MLSGPIVACSVNVADVVCVVVSVGFASVRGPLFFSPMGDARSFRPNVFCPDAQYPAHPPF